MKEISAGYDILCLQEVEEYNVEKITLEGYQAEYQPHVHKDNGLVTQFNKDMFELVERWQGGIRRCFLILKLRYGEQEFYVANCHLSWRDTPEISRHGELMEVIDALKELDESIPLVFGSDLNIEYGEAELDECLSFLKSAYPLPLPYTEYKFRGNEVVRRGVDYIFFRGLEVEEIQEIWELDKSIGIPNDDHGSDHLLLSAKLKWIQ